MLAAAVRHYLSMAATKKFNRVSSSILAVVIVATNLGAVANLYATPPNLYDHSRIKNLDVEDAEYIRSQVYDNNSNEYSKSVKFLFFDNLRAIDKETASVIAKLYRSRVRGVVLGVPSIDDDTLKQLLSTHKSIVLFNDSSEYPDLMKLVFNRLKTLSDSQVRMLLKWRGTTLVVPDAIEISTEAETLINDNFRSWEFQKLSESEMADYRQELIENAVK